MQHEKNIAEKIFDRDVFRPFDLIDRANKSAGLIWVYQSMEIELEEFAKKNPDHVKVKETQKKIDVLRELYTWLYVNYNNAEVLQKTSYEWQRMCATLTHENNELQKENIKLKKMLDAE